MGGRGGQQQEVGLLPDASCLTPQSLERVGRIEGFDGAEAAGARNDAAHGWLHRVRMFVEKALQRRQPFSDPGAAVEQAGRLAERLVVEAHRLTAESCECLDCNIELRSRWFVAKEFQTGFCRHAKAKSHAWRGPGRCALSGNRNTGVRIGGVEAARHCEDARCVGAGLRKNGDAIQRAAGGQQSACADPSA